MSKKILIVDDEEAICESMGDLLDTRGYNVTTAYNGVAGLKLTAEQKFDLIILDLNMPRMDGYMFMERIRERCSQSPNGEPFPKIMVLSAVDAKQDLGLAKDLGAAKFMNKPFKPAEFISTVQDLIGE